MKWTNANWSLSIVFVALFAVSIALGDEFYGKHLPPGVTMGMSLAEFQAARPNAVQNKLRRPGDAAASRLEMIEFSRRDTEAPSAFGYRFEAGKLASVTKATRTLGIPVEHTQAAVNALAEELKAIFTLKGREEIVRSAGAVTAVLTAQLWEDKIGGRNLYLVATNQERELMIFDPKVFGKADFFVGPEMLEKVKANNDRIGRTFNEPGTPPIPLVDLLAKMTTVSTTPTRDDKEVIPPRDDNRRPAPITAATQTDESLPANSMSKADGPSPISVDWALWAGIAAVVAAAAGWLTLRSKGKKGGVERGTD